MAAGFLYGVFLGMLMTILPRILPEAAGWAVFFSAVSVQMGIATPVVWRRTRLPAMTAAFALSSYTALIIAVAAADGILLPELFSRHPWTMAILMLLAPVSIYAERWLHPAQWQILQHRAQQATFLDVLRFRHIPDLRQTRHADRRFGARPPS